MTFSKSEVNRLGERLRSGSASTADLKLLDEYRRSFRPAFEEVETAVRLAVIGEVSGRSEKTTTSIEAKLRRSALQLSRIQDIAGLRIVGSDLSWQDATVAGLVAHWPDARVVDRRATPTFGYRAVHVIPVAMGLPIEVQVRTRLQHLWAQVSETAADRVGTALKYGGGPAYLTTLLLAISESVSRIESVAPGSDPELSGSMRDVELALLAVLRDVPTQGAQRRE